MVSGYPDYEGGKSKLYSGADWAALEAYDQNFFSFLANVLFNMATWVGYVVAAGRTLYITQISFSSHATAVADADNNQMCEGYIFDATTALWLYRRGGNGGGSEAFNKPIVGIALHTILMGCNNWANHNCDLSVSVEGYLI